MDESLLSRMDGQYDDVHSDVRPHTGTPQNVHLRYVAPPGLLGALPAPQPPQGWLQGCGRLYLALWFLINPTSSSGPGRRRSTLERPLVPSLKYTCFSCYFH